jgi:hypothetical protein
MGKKGDPSGQSWGIDLPELSHFLPELHKYNPSRYFGLGNA